MAMGLYEYAAAHPAEDTPPAQQDIADTARAIMEQKDRIEQAAQLKENIARLFDQGFDPEVILYWAVETIGLLTNDREWKDAQQEKLNRVYADLAQRSFTADNEAIAAERRAKIQQEYNDKLRGQLQRQLMGYNRIARGLNDALDALNALDPKDPEEILNGVEDGINTMLHR